MKLIAVNGSARKGWNTDLLLQSALEGARSGGAETELINLYDLDYKGCIGCLGCKRKGDEPRCVKKDGLSPLLDDIRGCDALILGSPVYLDEVTGEMRSLLERLLFQYISYDSFNRRADSLCPKRIKTAFIFTTNCPEHEYGAVGYTELFRRYERMLGDLLGECRTLAVSETWQTDDYDKYRMAMFDVPARRKRREEVFPEDRKKAFDIGAWSVR